uniref:Kinesin motor domain-containing protein n=1 Tax=Macrostomum lignano TaxID=282301 RepID=A0A1I8FL76_9PLAT
VPGVRTAACRSSQNPHKYLLLPPSLARLSFSLNSTFNDLPDDGVVLVYFSADAAACSQRGKKEDCSKLPLVHSQQNLQQVQKDATTQRNIDAMRRKAQELLTEAASAEQELRQRRGPAPAAKKSRLSTYSGYRDGGLAVQRSRESDKTRQAGELARLPGSGGVIRDSRRSPERQPVSRLFLHCLCLRMAHPAYQCFFRDDFLRALLLRFLFLLPGPATAPRLPAAALLSDCPHPALPDDLLDVDSVQAKVAGLGGAVRRQGSVLRGLNLAQSTSAKCGRSVAPSAVQTMQNRKCHYRQFRLNAERWRRGTEPESKSSSSGASSPKASPLLIVRSFPKIPTKASAKNSAANKSKSKQVEVLVGFFARASSSSGFRRSSDSSSSTASSQQFVPPGLDLALRLQSTGGLAANNRLSKTSASSRREAQAGKGLRR